LKEDNGLCTPGRRVGCETCKSDLYVALLYFVLKTAWQSYDWHRHEHVSLLELFAVRKENISLHFVFLMLLGFLPAGFYSLLLASQIRRRLAYFNSFLGFKQPLINSKLMFWNVIKIWETEHRS
jgi:hypothetical protein